MRQCLPEG
jgi:hypothetical protein